MIALAVYVLQSLKAENTRSKIKSINASLDPELLCLTQQAGDKGASSWLNAIPLKDQGLAVNNQEFTCDCGTIYYCSLRPFDVSGASV